MDLRVVSARIVRALPAVRTRRGGGGERAETKQAPERDSSGSEDGHVVWTVPVDVVVKAEQVIRQDARALRLALRLHARVADGRAVGPGDSQDVLVRKSGNAAA
jgi:hypothetical protein